MASLSFALTRIEGSSPGSVEPIRLPRAIVMPNDSGVMLVLRGNAGPAVIGKHVSKWRMSEGRSPFGPEIGIEMDVSQPEASPCDDSDRDGICDEWERHGVSGLDLPGMGAVVGIRDIFLEIDYVVPSLKKDAVQKVVDAFAMAPNGPIRLHVDYEPFNGTDWRRWSESNRIPLVALSVHQIFSRLKPANFSANRRGIFHYALLLSGPPTDAPRYLGQGETPGDLFQFDAGPIGDDIWLSTNLSALGSRWELVPVESAVTFQAALLMHELGHNLGLRHGGDGPEGDENLKPNYLSVMNYAFVPRGLRYGGQDGLVDYSRVQVNDLNEDGQLDEPKGLGSNAAWLGKPYGTRWSAWPLGVQCLQVSGLNCATDDARTNVNWDGYLSYNGTHVKANINGRPIESSDKPVVSPFTVLTSPAPDWQRIKLANDAIGHAAVASQLQVEQRTSASQSDDDDSPVGPWFLDYRNESLGEWAYTLRSPSWVVVEGPDSMKLPQLGVATLDVVVRNEGNAEDLVRLSVDSGAWNVQVAGTGQIVLTASSGKSESSHYSTGAAEWC